MFWKKKNNETADLSWLKTDIHSHLVPGIDDGSPDMETSLELIRGLSELGYEKLVTTPHILSDMYPNTPEIISSGTERLRTAIGVAGIPVTIHGAAEYYMDDRFDEQLRSKTPLLTISGNIVLVEFSMITAPMDLQDLIFEMQLQDYQPLIAHPERYIYLSRKKEFFDDLRSSGCLFQLNLLSLAGHYGSSVQELADYLVKKEYYSFAGTDLHHARHLEALRKLPASIIKRLKDSGMIRNDSL
jgi:tyrosine-protein phosphatase YwqE